MQTPQSSQARAKYETDGFYLFPEPIIDEAIIQPAIEGMDAVRAGEYDRGFAPRPSAWNPGDDPNKLCKIEMSQMSNHAIMDLISQPSIGKLAAELTGAEMVQVWWVQLLYKPPADRYRLSPTHIGWHQDRYYWQQAWEEGSELLTAWVAVSDVTPEAGPMKFVRGSHKWGLLDHSDFYGQDHEAQREEIEVPDGERWEEVPAILSPGGISFHNNLTYHGSGPNLSGEPRRSFAIHLRTEKSKPIPNSRTALTAFIHQTIFCPVIYRKK